MTFENKSGQISTILLGRNIPAVIKNKDLPFLKHLKTTYDGSYCYIFSCTNRQRTKEFKVYAYSMREDTCCYRVCFSSPYKVKEVTK